MKWIVKIGDAQEHQPSSVVRVSLIRPPVSGNFLHAPVGSASTRRLKWRREMPMTAVVRRKVLFPARLTGNPQPSSCQDGLR
ncbi:transcriptional regulator [Methylibium petroleiphilum PM1]|uniref:Transcriptional regulator n=1 Tax=Methylibium petroleiphilum (strain ATCC BAA-1232 / LMG 22953 / PM1) TaxID=420662 RepID=A2SJT3_METPP|nr:transcriptional regulator [Methylibium petroleiphilum PM1]